MVRGQTKFVAYYRVSTDKQGERGLGMEAQAAAVEEFVRSHNGKTLATFKEVESGKRDDNRPQLQAALARAQDSRGGSYANWIYRIGQYGRPDGPQHDQEGAYPHRQRRPA